MIQIVFILSGNKPLELPTPGFFLLHTRAKRCETTSLDGKGHTYPGGKKKACKSERHATRWGVRQMDAAVQDVLI